MKKRQLDYLQIGERIRQLRERRGMTQGDLAKAFGFSNVTISQTESGIKISLNFLLMASKLFGVPTDYLLFGDSGSKDFLARIEITDRDKPMIEQTEGAQWVEKFVPIPIAKDPISGGNPLEVRADPDGVAVIYERWARNRENFTAVWVKGASMEPTIANGSLVGIDHSEKDIRELNGKIVALRKDGKATVKRLRIVSKSLVLGLPDNPDFMEEALVLKGEEIDTALIGKVAWWWGKQ